MGQKEVSMKCDGNNGPRWQEILPSLRADQSTPHVSLAFKPKTLSLLSPLGAYHDIGGFYQDRKPFDSRTAGHRFVEMGSI